MSYLGRGGGFQVDLLVFATHFQAAGLGVVARHFLQPRLQYAQSLLWVWGWEVEGGR